MLRTSSRVKAHLSLGNAVMIDRAIDVGAWVPVPGYLHIFKRDAVTSELYEIKLYKLLFSSTKVMAK